MTQATPQRRVQRVRHELRMRDVEIVRREQVSPHFVSLTFAGEALDGFVSAGFDDHIKFIFTDADGTEIRRDYTPRRFDAQARELTVEFALHGDGKACQWAERAQVGGRAVIGGPRGSMIVPLDFAWHLFIADATGLPAVHRRLEEMPAGTRAIALLQVEAADRRDFASAADLDLRWLDSTGDLLAAAEALRLPAGEGFAWGAGEAASMVRVRSLLTQGKGHPKEAMRIAAYWRQGESDYHEELGQ
ncbi:siderophore-interacting protein [Pseudomonas jinjuensis]|uniref:NADPH-dependent ferric siderophore reductase, contains FAD-binding and SIP domains n=1 Tax=Pseudomonas jinjuensis TaxID=198616 RepID=A0A1H0ECI9_9PSED|nr:siderophore-interacting protein [Pseudomonas jinjuensis]SDN80134.1 NADPH-dependent ferric siderophore reductase, contains FAD-binding and SIP domains [Pseudomonas jinjuensis]